MKITSQTQQGGLPPNQSTCVCPRAVAMHLSPTFNCDLYLDAAYRNAKGSVEEDPVALLQASHTAAKPSQVWCALLLPHMQLIPSSSRFHRVLCCAVNFLPWLATLQCSIVTSQIEDMMISSFGLLSLHFFCLFCFCCVFPFPITCLPSLRSLSCVNSWHLSK